MKGKYPPLSGICERAIKYNLCFGCNKLENPLFRGQAKCDLAQDPIQKTKMILGIQEKII